MLKMFGVMFVMTVVFIVAVWALVVTVGIKGCDAVRDHGLKGVINEVWTGTNTVAQ